MSSTKQRESNPQTSNLNGASNHTANLSDPSPTPVPRDFRANKRNVISRKSLGSRLFVWVLSGALVGIGGISILFYQRIEKAAVNDVKTSLDIQAFEVEIQLNQVKEFTESLAASSRFTYRNGERRLEAYKALVFEFFNKRPALAMAAGIGQTPYGILPKQEWFWPYYYVDQGKKEQQGTRLPAPFDKVFYSELFKDDNYPTQNYYKQPVAANKSLWTETYPWYGVTMTTYLSPVRNDEGKLIAVVGTDVNVTTIAEGLTNDKVYQDRGYFALISEEGKMLAYPPDLQKAIERVDFKQIPEFAAIESQLKQGKEGSIRSGGNLIYYKRLPSTNWLFLAIIPESVIYTPVLITTLSSALGVTLLLAIIVLLFVRNLNKRLQPILDECNKMAATDDIANDLTKNSDEIDRLSSSFFNLVGQQTNQLEQQTREARQLGILATISRMRDIMGLVEPFEQLLAEIRAELNCDRLVVYQFKPDWSGEINAESSIPGLPSAKAEEFNDPCIGQVLIEAYQKGRIVANNDVHNAGFHPDHLALMQRLRIKSNLVVPIFRAGELTALLIAHHCNNLHQWQEAEIELLKQKAFSIGQALGGLGLLEQKAVTELEKQRSQKIQSDLFSLLNEVEGAASGDLTVRAQISDDEIGIVADFFNAIIENLRDVVTQVKQTTAKVNTSIGSNDVAIRGLAESAMLQAQQLDDALQSVEKMTVSIQDVARNAKQASDASSTAANTAESGSQAIERSAESILQLRQTVAETAKKVKRLGEASQQISKVVVLIDQIALKTNMLAVNASIEAARAGEEGRGFAVVAEEVGALATQSATATKEIERIVATIQQETSEVVEAMEASTEQVVAGTQQVESARKSLGQIVEVSRQVNELFQSISGATVSQVQTSEAVKVLMQNLATMSHQSSQTSRDVSDALQDTVSVANQLQASVETFKVEA
ncbi:methyl-accepting chemotaxis protein [Tumidithrix helvetica PCC 7403]|uniref:methyl-accepting chemotaxis protein n=1 Tax=Tumidithrix helvetica TaxID=3457545 RepID=UPI003CB2D470